MKFEEITDMAEQAMSKAMMQLMRSKNQTYITCVLLSLPRTFTNESETAGVNGIQMKINPEFFLGLPESERRFLLVHEAWHIGLFDIIRGKGKDHQVWNIACDHYINLMIDGQKDSALSFIEGGCMNSKYADWEKEDIYQDLLKKSSSEPQGALGSDLMPGRNSWMPLAFAGGLSPDPGPHYPLPLPKSPLPGCCKPRPVRTEHSDNQVGHCGL